MGNQNDGKTREQNTRGGEERRDARRRVLKAGALLVPTIITLRATPAWATTDYTQVAYRYGAGAGMCKNPQFNSNASRRSPNSRRFIPCP